MSISDARPAIATTSPSFLATLRTRQLEHYPNTAARYAYLGLTVVITVALYYELYVGGSVSTLQLTDLHMSFTFYVTLLAIGNLIGAFGSLFAGLTDRLGRCNIVVAGLLVAGVMTAVVLPNMHSKWGFGISGWFVGVVEGICLVATPALIRDFSPQVGRGAAMGFWTMGPVLGSLVVAEVGSLTISGTPAPSFWGHEYVICGIVGLVVFVAAFVFLRELSPGLRDQLMVTTRDRALVEARAKGIDIESALRSPWSQVLKPDIVISAIGVSVLLLVYYTAVGFGTIYYTTIFGFSLHQANDLADWNWGINVLALVFIGLVSDAFRVRKPFMVAGGVWAGVFLILYLGLAGSHPSYLNVAAFVSLLSFGLGLAYTPWMASFTESVEARNPALTATGLAIWGWILRVVVFVSFMVIPVVISSVTPLVNYGATVAADAKQYGPALAFAQKNPALISFAKANSGVLGVAAAHPALVQQVTQYRTQLAALSALAAKDPADLRAVEQHAAVFAALQKFAPEVAVISAHQSLFLRLAADPTSATLQAQAVAAAGGGSKGVAILATIAGNQATLTPALRYAAANPTVVAFAQANAATLGFAASHAALVAEAQKYAASLAALGALQAAHPALMAQVAAHSAQLAVLAKVPPAAIAYLTAHGTAVEKAAAQSPGQWKTWYWICFGGIIVFLLAVPLLKGRWSPAKARADEEAHEAMVLAELAKLAAG
ncbi:MAG: MFS transporter [Acidimicrobiales bacterium]